MLIDAVQSVGKFMRITAARVHDKNFLEDIRVPAYSMLVFDKACNYYEQFGKWTNNSIYFVSWQKSNAVYTVIKRVSRQKSVPNVAMVTREQ